MHARRKNIKTAFCYQKFFWRRHPVTIQIETLPRKTPTYALLSNQVRFEKLAVPAM
jgi:hypothetical protein